MAHLVISTLMMSAVLVGMFHIMPDWSQGTMLWCLLRLMAVVVASIAAYLAALAVLGSKIKEFVRRTVQWTNAGWRYNAASGLQKAQA